MAHGDGRLVGRDFYLGRLGDAVSRGRSGVRTVVLIEADAGLGKSRLVRESLARFREPDDVVGFGYGVELAGGEIPYGVASGLLRTLSRDAGVDRVREAAGEYAHALRPLYPDLSSDGDVEASPARALPATVALVEQLAADRLVWLVIEDLPWVDESSRDLLAYLVRVAVRCRLLVLVTVRTHDPATDPAIGELVDSWTVMDGVDRFMLPPLDPEQVAALVGDLTAGAATSSQVVQLVRMARGSPLLTEQLIASGVEQPALAVADPMLARIRRLDPDTLRLLQLAALGNGHLSFRLLRRAYAGSDARFDAAVDRALAVGLLDFGADDREFSFSHALIRHATEETLSPAERLHGHERWGEVLSAPENNQGEGGLQIAAARHWAATDNDSASLMASLTAARATTRMGAATQSADFLLCAWTLWDRVPDAGADVGQTRDDVLLDLVSMLASADRMAEAISLLEGEVERSGSDGADPMRRLCLRLTHAECRESFGQPEDEQLYAEAQASADALMGAPASRLLIQPLHAFGWFLRWSDPAQSFQVHERAMEVSRQVGTALELTTTTTTFADQLAQRGRHDEALALCDRSLGSDLGPIDRLSIETSRAEVLGYSGHILRAATSMQDALERLPDPRLAPSEWAFAATRASRWLIALGNWDLATELYKQCAELTLEDWIAGTWVLSDSAIHACHRGRLDEAESLAEHAWENLGADEESVFMFPRLAARMARAHVLAARADHDAARRVLAPMLAMPGTDSFAGLWRAALLAAQIEGDRAAAPPSQSAETSAQASVAQVRDVVDRLPRNGLFLTACYYQARADLARAELVDTPDDWVGVRDRWRDLGHIFNLGWASLRVSEALVRADAKKAAAAPLTEAMDIAHRLGAVRLLDSVAELARRARIPVLPGATGNDRPIGNRPSTGRLARLTDRELEVLRHVVLGESNDEIASTLFISPRTVSVHVSRILTKLDVSSRSKATAVAFEEGLDLGRD